MKRLPILAAAALVGCQLIPGTDAAMKHDAEHAIRAVAVDPDAAQFKDVRVVVDGNRKLVCGLVNLTNRMGGKDGFRPFYYRPDKREGAPFPYEDGTNATALAIVSFPAVCGKDASGKDVMIRS